MTDEPNLEYVEGYTPLDLQALYSSIGPPIDGHFLAKSKKSAGLWTFFENPTKRAKGIRTAIKPGRYLTKFYPHLSSDRIARIAALSVPGNPVEFTSCPDMIEQVYLNGPNSCMSHSADEYAVYGGSHPVRIYGNSPDLMLAYMRSTTYPNVYSARALVWPDRKLVGRIYGDETRLVEALKDEGYYTGGQPLTYSNLIGARINYVENGSDEKRVVCPYIDGSNQVSGPVTDDKGTWLIIGWDQGPKNYDAGFAGGLATVQGREQHMFVCGYSGEVLSYDDPDEMEDDMVFMYDGEVWHRSSAEYHAFCCDHSGEYYPQSMVKYVFTALGKETWGDIDDVWECENTGLLYSIHDFRPFRYAPPGTEPVRDIGPHAVKREGLRLVRDGDADFDETVNDGYEYYVCNDAVDNPKLPLPEPEVIPPDFAREAHVRNIFDEVVDEYLAANPVRQAA
jgi:hypothetical protein